MMRGCLAVYYREWLILRRRLPKLLGSMAVSPLLYLVAFGCAMAGTGGHEGRPYLEFLLPGLAAMTSMTQAWSMSGEINVSRFYWRIFDEFQASPVGNAAYVAGEVLAGMTRAVLAVLLTILLGAFFGVFLDYGPVFWLGVLLNAFAFASLAVCLAMLVKSHADQSLLNSFVITPMAFLGGTFFPVDRLPALVRPLLSLLPLTHASGVIRAGALERPVPVLSLAVLAGAGAVFFFLAWRCVDRARD